MLAYPITLENDDGTLLVTSPDFPELTTFGDDREEALACAVHALEEALAARIHDRKDIPTPSLGETYAVLPTLISVKVMLYREMRDQGIGKAELARRLGWYMPQVDRGAGRPAPVGNGRDGRCLGRRRTAVARNRRSHGPFVGCSRRRDPWLALAAMGRYIPL